MGSFPESSTISLKNLADSEAEEPPQKRHKSSSRKTDNSDDSDSKQNFHRDDPQIGVCLQYLRWVTPLYNEYPLSKKLLLFWGRKLIRTPLFKAPSPLLFLTNK